MPKTKFQDFIFTILMVLVMVYCMTLYNKVLLVGLSYSTFLDSLTDMWYEAIAAFIAQTFVAGPIAKHIVFGKLQPGIDKPLIITIAMAGCTVSLMAPMMTLFVTILHNGFVTAVPLLWLPKLVLNFPAALCLQIFYVGPFVRFIFRLLFNKQLLKTPAKQLQM